MKSKGPDEGANKTQYIVETVIAFSFFLMLFYVAMDLTGSFLIQSDNQLARGLGAATYLFNVYMCHQLPTRAIFLFGQQMPVCSRVFALTFGAMLAFPAAFIRRRLPKFLASEIFVIATIALLAIDGFTQLFGWRESNAFFRIITGSAAFAIMYYLLVTLLDRYSTGQRILRPATLKPALAALAAVLVIVLGISYFIGGTYHSKSFFVGKAMQQASGVRYIDAFYISPHSFALTLLADSYVGTYNDPVLQDAVRLSNPSHSSGVWVIAALTEPPKKEGKFVYLSGGSGRYFYFDAWSGELIAETSH